MSVTYPPFGVAVVGALIDQALALGGPGEPGVAYVEALDWDGTWPLGSVPGSVTITVSGSDRPGGTVLPDAFLNPNTPKAVRIGDGQAWMEIRNLWVETADPSEWNLAASAEIKVRLQDRRIWWHSRPPMGPRAYNCEQFAERIVPSWFTGPGGPGGPGGARYDPRTRRTGEQILTEIFAWLGESPGNVKLRGGNGWADLSSAAGRGGSILADTPEFVLGEGASPVDALEKFCSIYDLLVGISPDTDDVGFVFADDIPSRLAATKAHLESMMRRALNPIESGSYAYDRDPTPDIIYITGAPMMIGDYLTLEPVCRDPDAPEMWIPLNQISTMRAYGFPMSEPGWNHLTNGNACIRFATGVSDAFTADGSLFNVPPRLYGYVREWFRIWRVAQSLETFNPGGAGRPSIVHETLAGLLTSPVAPDPKVYVRSPAPFYRLKRAAPSGIPTPTSWAPGIDGMVAEPGRLLPILGHTEEMLADGSYGKLRVFGANVLRAANTYGQDGNAGPDWIYIGESIDPEGWATGEQLVNLGLEPVLIDPEQGIVDLGEAVYGHEGVSAGSLVVGSAIPPWAQPGVMLRDFYTREFIRHRITPASEYKAPLGMAYLVLHCAFYARSHGGTSEDSTSAYSEPHATRGGDTFASVGSTPAYLRAGLPTLPAAPGRVYPLVSYQTGLPDLQLRCSTGRRLSGGAIDTPSFSRFGGYASGDLGGVSAYDDVELGPAAAAGLGGFSPVSQDHFLSVRSALETVITRASEGIAKFRSTPDNLRCINAQICGVHRDFFPGVGAFADHPVDSVAFQGSGDGVNAGMRIAANSRGWRPYVDSAVAKVAATLAQHRGAASSISGIMRGGSGE